MHTSREIAVWVKRVDVLYDKGVVTEVSGTGENVSVKVNVDQKDLP